jgi:hypothetical protein
MNQATIKGGGGRAVLRLKQVIRVGARARLERDVLHRHA